MRGRKSGLDVTSRETKRGVTECNVSVIMDRSKRQSNPNMFRMYSVSEMHFVKEGKCTCEKWKVVVNSIQNRARASKFSAAGTFYDISSSRVGCYEITIRDKGAIR